MNLIKDLAYIYSKYAWVITLKDKKRIKISNVFQKVNFNRSVKARLQDNNIEMYSTHSEERFIVAKRCISL